MSVNIQINGKNYEVNLATLPADITLNTFLREQAQLTATKFMCLEGGCGSCTCVITHKNTANGKMRTHSALSCLTLLNSCLDTQITTCEGLGNTINGYHPIQRRLAKLHGTQCGYCSPGFVMNMYGLLQSKAEGKSVTMTEVEKAFGGNLCRCTGYRPILDAMKSFAADSNIELPQDIEDLCLKKCTKITQKCLVKCTKTLRQLHYVDGAQWYWPKNIEDLFAALYSVGTDEYMLAAGNTAHGLYRRSTSIKHFIDVNAVPELKQYKLSSEKLTLGANLTISEVMEYFLQAAEEPGFEYCKELWQHFDTIATLSVRNTGTLAGNISTKKAHPEFISDVCLTFECLNVQVLVKENAITQRKMTISEYLKSPTMKMVLVAFELTPYPPEKYVYKSYKIMPRSQNANAYVNAAFLLEMNITSGKVAHAFICYGGIRPDFVHATEIEELLIGNKIYAKETVAKIFERLSAIVRPDEVPPSASPEFRTQLACGIFYKFLLSIAPDSQIKEEYKSGAKLLQRPLSSGIQTFETNKKMYPVTQAVDKLEAQIQTSGEAKYTNDHQTTLDAVYCAFVSATKVNATIEHIDATSALLIPGVIGFYSAKDISGKNSFVNSKVVYYPDDEEIFCSGLVKYYDQPLGMIVAQSSDIAKFASTKVEVLYSYGDKVVLPTMLDVFAHKEMHRLRKGFESGAELTSEQTSLADISARGIFEIGSQYHFTMEPHTTIVVPEEQCLKVWSSTQVMNLTQIVIAEMLQLPLNAVQLRMRRIGGAYGAKISRGNQVACAAALAAYKLNRPAHFVQSIESMLSCVGKRWACLSDYEFHIKSNGKIVFLKNSFYEDAGSSMNEYRIPDILITRPTNAYLLNDSNYKVSQQAVLTDAPSSAMCRAPGFLEIISMFENILEHIAFEANVDPADARLANLQPDGKMAELLQRFIKSTEYRQRRREIDAYNLKNRWRKRGLGLSIMEFFIAYPFTGYPVTVVVYYGDGTVVITHGGIEMGQGINTKLAQVAAYFLRIPLQSVRVVASDTINGANSTGSVASITSESVASAVRAACNTLNERLKPTKESLPKDTTWSQLVQIAYERNVNLIVSDQYNFGDLKPYYVYGLSLSELEVDILTGSQQIKRVDILEDTGESLSPNIDVGQIEGAFVMSLGYWLTEQVKYDRRTGQLLTNRTRTYLPPGARDIPIDFRIELLQKSANAGGFMRSKATGEPASCLAISVIFALQHAIQSARKDAGLKREWVRLGAPTTSEHILLNVGNDVKSFALE